MPFGRQWPKKIKQQALGLLIDGWNPLPIDSRHPPIPEHHDVPPAAVAHFRASKVVPRIADRHGCNTVVRKDIQREKLNIMTSCLQVA